MSGARTGIKRERRTRWITSDNRQWETVAEATRHETALTLAEVLEANLGHDTIVEIAQRILSDRRLVIVLAPRRETP